MVMNQRTIRIVTWSSIVASHATIAGLDTIFYAASGTQTFPSDSARAAFRERWLGSYLTYEPSEAFLAIDRDGSVAGYLVGALRDPVLDQRHADLGYFQDFAHVTPRYPAHLHVNVASQYRSAGLGARLVEAFAAHAQARGAPGVHVVTGQGMRNVGFYLRNGFVEVAEAPWNGRTVVMLGRTFG